MPTRAWKSLDKLSKVHSIDRRILVRGGQTCEVWPPLVSRRLRAAVDGLHARKQPTR